MSSSETDRVEISKADLQNLWSTEVSLNEDEITNIILKLQKKSNDQNKTLRLITGVSFKENEKNSFNKLHKNPIS